MKAIVIERYGRPEAPELKDVAKPTPKRNEVLVRVHAASINDWDWGLLHGTPVVNRIVALKPNKDLAYMNELFEDGSLSPVIDGPYTLADLPEAFRRFGMGDHKGKIIVTMT